VIDGAAVVMQWERLGQITASVNAERRGLRKRDRTGQEERRGEERKFCKALQSGYTLKLLKTHL